MTVIERIEKALQEPHSIMNGETHILKTKDVAFLLDEYRQTAEENHMLRGALKTLSKPGQWQECWQMRDFATFTLRQVR